MGAEQRPKRKEHGCVMPTPIHRRAIKKFENLVGHRASFTNFILRHFEGEGFASTIPPKIWLVGLPPCPPGSNGPTQ